MDQGCEGIEKWRCGPELGGQGGSRNEGEADFDSKI